MTLALLVGATPFLISACEEGGMSGPLMPEHPNAELKDGSTTDGEYKGFLFLAPLVATPDKGGQSPIPGLAPHAEVCLLNTVDTPWACESTYRTFSAAEITYNGAHYAMQWDTQDPNHTVQLLTSDPNGVQHTYRLTVFLGSLQLGFVDLQFGDNGGTAKNLTTDEIVGLKDGRTVPVNFFLGDALEDDICGEGLDCQLGTAYWDQYNLFVTRDKQALLEIPVGALPEGGPYSVIIRELPEAECDFDFPADLPNGAFLPEYHACYDYTLDPDPILLSEVVVGQCIDENAAGDRIEELQLGARHSADPDERPEGVPEYELLPNVSLPETLLCDGYAPPQPSTSLAFLGEATQNVLAFLFGTPAYAGHSGLGGAARELSIVKWVDPGVRVAGFSESRGGVSSIRSPALDPAMQALVATYGYVWRDTSSVLSGSLFDGDVDVTILGTPKTQHAGITALTAAEQEALEQYVLHGGCAILMPDHVSFAGVGITDTINESLIEPFGLDITGTVAAIGTMAYVVNADSSTVVDGITTFRQTYPGWFDGIGQGIVLANNSGGPALVEIAAGVLGAYAGPVFAFSDVNMFSAGPYDSGYYGLFGDAANRQLFLNTVNACGTEPSPPPPPVIE